MAIRVMAAITRLNTMVLKVNITPMSTRMPTIAVIMRVFIGLISFVLPAAAPCRATHSDPRKYRVCRVCT